MARGSGDRAEGNGGLADAGGDVARNYTALAALYVEWARATEPGRLALVTDGVVRDYYATPAAARAAVGVLPDTIGHALVATLWPLDGWRHPRFVVESYLRRGGAPPAPSVAADPLTRDFLLAERLRYEITDVGNSAGPINAGASTSTPTAGDLDAPYLLIKDSAVLARFRRVAQARQAVDAALPPLPPVLFTSLRQGRMGPFDIMVLQALIDHDGT